MKHLGTTALSLLAALQFSAAPAQAAEPPALEAGTRIYLTLDENVSSARGGGDVGTIVRCRVWRDVESRGVVVIKAGAPATCRVDKVSRRNMAGTEGKVSVGGVETHAVDGQTVMLSGGYNKEGSGHKAVVWTVGLLLFWPALFVPGGNAELPPGTGVGVSTENDRRLAEATAAAAPKMVDLRGLASGLSAEFMLDDFIQQPKHDTFRIKLTKEGQLPDQLFIDNVNGQPVEPIPLAVKTPAVKDGEATGVAEASAKVLAKHFVRGINRFEVAYKEAGQRQATEVVMDVQM